MCVYLRKRISGKREIVKKNPRTTFNACSNNGDGINKTLVNAIKSNTFSSSPLAGSGRALHREVRTKRRSSINPRDVPAGGWNRNRNKTVRCRLNRIFNQPWCNEKGASITVRLQPKNFNQPLQSTGLNCSKFLFNFLFILFHRKENQRKKNQPATLTNANEV